METKQREPGYYYVITDCGWRIAQYSGSERPGEEAEFYQCGVSKPFKESQLSGIYEKRISDIGLMTRSDVDFVFDNLSSIPRENKKFVDLRKSLLYYLDPKNHSENMIKPLIATVSGSTDLSEDEKKELIDIWQYHESV
jgi:hypothetical protein